MKQTTIDTSLLPEIWLFWETTKGTYYLECKTGKKQQKRPTLNDCAMWINNRSSAFMLRSGSAIRMAYTKYHEDIKMLEIAVVEMPTTRKEEIHNWRYAGGKYFINKDKVVYDQNGNICTNNSLFDAYKDHASYGFKYYLTIVSRLGYMSQDSIKEFHKFLDAPYYTISTGKTIDATQFWHIQDWYAKKAFVRKENVGKEQKLVNKLAAIPLADITNELHKYPVLSHESFFYSIKNIMYYERINEEWSVLRMFRRYLENNVEVFEEVERMYISDKGANRIAAPTKEGWMPAKQTYSYNQTYQFVNKQEAIEKCPRIKYVASLIGENAPDVRERLFTVLRFPEIEQLMKLGHTELAMKIINSNTPKAAFKEAFGWYCNDKEKNLLRKIGLTKEQLGFYARQATCNRYYYNYPGKALARMRKFFGDDLSHIDNDTFNKYYNMFLTIIQNHWAFEDNMQALNVNYNAFYRNVMRLYTKNPTAITVLSDTMSLARRLDFGTCPEVNWIFDSYSELTRTHDALDTLQRAQQAERMAAYRMSQSEREKKMEEKRKKIDEKRKDFEYEDEKYIIRLPKNGTEITNEGLLQSICIGGYVDRHSNGHTNLFFIREKSNENVPFYAIEMNNSKEIVQIHGRYNKWLGNNPEAIPTVIRWLRKNGIQCRNEILTCKSTGYGRTAEYVPMPEVD